MVSLFIVLILSVGAYAGYKRGLILQLIQTIGYAFSLLAAMMNYRSLSDFLYLLVPYSTPFAPETNPYPFYDIKLMFSMDQSYYDLLAFLVILFIGWAVVRFLAGLLSYTMAYFKAPRPLSEIGGAAVGFMVNYVGLFYILFFLTTLPFDFIQQRLVNSSLASSMIASTPTLSDSTYQTFILDVYEEVNQEEPMMDIVDPDAEQNEEPTEENSE